MMSSSMMTPKMNTFDIEDVKANNLETPESEREEMGIPSSTKIERLLGKFANDMCREKMIEKNTGPYSKSERKRKEDQKQRIMRTPAKKKNNQDVLTSKKQLLHDLSDEIEDDDIPTTTSNTKVRITSSSSTGSMMEPIVGTSQKSKKRGSTELDNRNNSLEENRDPEATIEDDEAMNTYKNMMDFEKEYEKRKQLANRCDRGVDMARCNNSDNISPFIDPKRRKKGRHSLKKRSTTSEEIKALRNTTNDGLPEIRLKYEESQPGLVKFRHFHHIYDIAYIYDIGLQLK